MKQVLMAVALLLAACGSSQDDTPPPPKPKEGRAETQSIRNTQAVGISGKAIADNVDKAMKANEDAIKKTEKESSEDAPAQDAPQDAPPQQ